MNNANNKGFFLIETLIVTTVVSLAMVFLYSQLTQITNGYELRMTYNTVDGMYALSNVNDYILDDNKYATLTSDGEIDVNGFVQVTCADFSNLEYCNTLLSNLNIDKIYITKYNTASIKSNAPGAATLTDGVRLFVSNMKNISDAASDEYRLIAEFKDNTYATSKLNVSDDEAPIITGSVLLMITTGESYNPAQGLVAIDNIYGDISDNIICVLDTGTTYNCTVKDSDGNTSATFVRTVVEN